MEVSHCLGVGGADGLVRRGGPHGLEEEDGTRPESPHIDSTVGDLLVEGDHDICRLAHVGHRSRSDPDPIAAGPGS